MKAIRFYGINNLKLVDVEVPKPKSDEILVKVRSCGICGSDRHTIRAGYGIKKIPVTMGHEAAFEVVKLGKDVAGDSNLQPLKISDKLTALDIIPCGRCYFCKRGLYNHCRNAGYPGYSTDGFFCAYQTIKWNSGIKTLDGLSDKELASVEPCAGALHAVKRANISPGQTITVLGCGPIGLFQQEIIKNTGATTLIATDVSEYRRNLAKKVGANVTLDPKKDDVIKYVLDETDGLGSDVVLDAVGRAETIKAALQIVKPTGTIVVMGLGATGEVSIDFSSLQGLVAKEINLLGSFTYSLWPDAPSDYLASMKMMKADKINVNLIITHTFAIDEWKKAFALGPENSGKIMFTDLE